jgi:hypothetical protein
MILALDNATRLGFCQGAIGASPTWGAHDFGRKRSNGEVLSAFRTWLCHKIDEIQPTIIVFESPYMPGPNSRFSAPANALTIRRLFAFAGFTEAICVERRVRCYEARPSEITRAFLGGPAPRQRAEKKAATIKMARLLGYAVADDDEADAVALWCFAESVFAPAMISQRRANVGLELSLHPPNEDASQFLAARRRGIVQPPKRRGVAHGNRKSNTAATGKFQFALKMKRRPMPAGASEVDRPLFSESPAKVKRRPVDGRRFEGETDGSYPSPSPAPDYGDLAGDRQPHDRLVAGRESGLAPGSFPRSRP